MNFSEEELHEILYGTFHPDCSDSEKEVREMLTLRLETEAEREAFESDVQDIILDSMETFAQKARRYVEMEYGSGEKAERKARALFEKIWAIVAAKPFPETDEEPEF